MIIKKKEVLKYMTAGWKKKNPTFSYHTVYESDYHVK